MKRPESPDTFIELLYREYGALDKINDYSLKYVMTLDAKDTSANGITHINIIDSLTK